MRSLLSLTSVLVVLAGCQCQPNTTGSRCQFDAECPGALVCNTIDDTCVECLSNENCPSGLCLPDNHCSACGPNAKCAQGEVCAADGSCKSGCETDTAGCTDGLYCLPGSVSCVECIRDAQCGPGRVCDQGHVCRGGCSALNPVCVAGQVCDVDGGTCVGCVTNADCHAPQPVCDPATRSCVGCIVSTDCKDPSKPVCDAPNHQCVACNVDTDCGPGNVCNAMHQCTAGCSQQNPACLNGQICNVPKGQCVQCNDDAQCGGATPRCEPATNRCVACLPGANDNCPLGQYCRPDFVCERGCKTGADCPSGMCLPDHSCGSCTTDTQCAAGQVCNNGTCIAACSATNPCGSGKQCCAAHCVDYQNDKNNCGGCGITCGGAQGCCNGTCANLDTPAHCGACGTTCGVGSGCCNNACVSTTTLQRCGACNVACGQDQFCDGTSCRNVTFPEFCANKKVYAIYDGIALDDGATNVLASTIAANCSSTTVITYGPQSNPQWVDQTTGQLLLGSGSTVVTAGGPFANKPVKWLERTSNTTKVYFSTNNIDTFYFKRRSDDVTLVSQPAATCSSHHDILLVELAADPVNGTLALIGYGVCSGGYGTQAAGWFYANVMLPNRMAYPDSWYLFEWTDTNNDSLPNLGDTFMRLASGM